MDGGQAGTGSAGGSDDPGLDDPAHTDRDRSPRRALAGCDDALARVYDVALLDLDGVVYVGPEAVRHAPAALAAARALGQRLAFVTNNAARPPWTVAEHLTRLGIAAVADEVVTSAQAAARVVADLVPPGSAVLVVGTVGLDEALRERGLQPVHSATDDPLAVVQGYSPDLGWLDLAEGAYALARGVPWVASNADTTIPTPRGRAPGNGTFVQVLRMTTGREPVVAGKPEPPMHREALIRTGARSPIVVGDRLDTDIEGATRADVDSLLVFTGVTDPLDVVLAEPGQRPTYVSADLRGLLEPHPAVAVDDDRLHCRGWEIDATAPTAAGRLRGTGDPFDALRLLCAWAWRSTSPPAVLDVAQALAGAGLPDRAVRPGR